MPTSVTSSSIDTEALARDFLRADIEFHGVDHSGATYEGRVFLNQPDADDRTPRSGPGYAGSFTIFGHGGCLGDEGHCDVKPRRLFDLRPGHPLTGARKVVIATDAVRHALASAKSVTVTVVPVILSTTPRVGRPDDVVQYDEVRIVTYQ